MAKEELNFDEVVFDEVAKANNLDHLEVPLSRAVFFFLVLAAILIAGAVTTRVFYLNVFNKNFYQGRAAANANREVELSAARGIIVDRFGEVLAENIGALSVSVDVAELLKDENAEQFELVTGKLGEILKIDVNDLKKLILETDLEKTGSVMAARDISVEEAIAVRGLNLPAARVINDYKRGYVDGPIFAHIIGYTGMAEQGNDIIGKTGLEAYYNDRLSGRDGVYVLYQDALGGVLEEKVIREPTSGEELATTIDAGLQRYFYDSLSRGLRALGRSSGVGIAINPRNGEVLALISLPGFDNNIFVARGRNEEKRRLLESSAQPLFNRAISGIYTPGSAIKPLVALAALKENIVKPDYQIFSAGFIEIPNPYDPENPSRFLDWKPHGWVDLHSALARSSNIYFYGIGGGLPGGVRGLGIRKLKEYWQKLGFGERTGIDLPSENIGFLPDPEEKEERVGDIWRIGDTYNVSIGQGDFLVTPLQLVNFIASVGNGGRAYRPRLARDEKLEMKNETLADYSNWESELREVQKGLEDAVSEYYGTASLLSGLPISSAGKTGSAQIANNTRTNAFFVGYMPAENPRIAILVLIENAREGSLNAVPIAKDVLEWYYYSRIMNHES